MLKKQKLNMCKTLFKNLFRRQKDGREQIASELAETCPMDANTLQRLLSGLTEQTALNCDTVEIRPLQDWEYLHKYGVVDYFANEHQAMLTAKGRALYTKLMSNPSVNQDQLSYLIQKS